MPPEEREGAERLFSHGEGSLSVDERVRIASDLIEHCPSLRPIMLRRLFGENEQLYQNLSDVGEVQSKLKAMIEKLTAPPLHPAVFLCSLPTPGGMQALVAHGNSRSVVGPSEEVPIESLKPGDEVLLSNQMNAILARSPWGVPPYGDTAMFKNLTADNRLVLQSRDQEVVVAAASTVVPSQLKSGQLVRWDRASLMAFEAVERSRDSDFLIEETPSETFADVGGLDPQVRLLKRQMSLHLTHPEVVRRYKRKPARGITLHGPPGTGKTLIARALANWAAELSSSGRARFMNIKPGAMRSMWYGQSSAICRETFRVAGEVALEDPESPMVVFLDELDAVGSRRSTSMMRVDDRVLQALQAELDGFAKRELNVILIAATNRLDVIDEALIREGRFGDLLVEVPKPNAAAAADIFAKHLPADIPYAANGHGDDAEAAQAEIIRSVVSRLYAPNGLGELAQILFDDNKVTRSVTAADLISGAMIANIAQTAIDAACVREAEGGEPGVSLSDVLTAADEKFETVISVLTPENCGSYVSGLPRDKRVVDVRPVVRKVRQPHKYVVLDAAG